MEKMISSDKDVKLVGFWVSPFVQRVKWALKLKGIEYEYIEEDIFNKSPLISEINPVYGKVPVLIHNGNPIPESFIILEYIDQTWDNNNPLLPLDALQRAHARFWAQVVEEKLLFSAGLAHGSSEGEQQEKAVKTAIETLEKLEETLKGKRFFGGDTIGFLDLVMGFVSYMLPVWEEVASVKIFDPLKFPGIAAWKDDFINHEVIKGGDLPSRDDMVSYFRRRRTELIPILAGYYENHP